MAIVAYLLPVLPGKSERLLRSAQEFNEHLADYEELNRKAALRRHLEFLQRTPQGDFLIVIYESDDPARLNRAFTDSEYDRWWVARLKDIFGVEASGTEPPPSPDVTATWVWERPLGETPAA
jgi:hypothetical protein